MGVARLRSRLTLMAAVVAVLTMVGPGIAPVQAEFPERPIEYVVQASAGGSSDRFVRTVVQFLEDAGLAEVPITVVNVAGGGGALAANYLRGKRGNPYYLLNTSGNFIAAPLRDPSVPGYRDFTPVARLAFDLNSIVVRADSPYRTMDDLVNAARSSPLSIAWGGTSIGSQDHLTALALERVSGARFNFVSFTASNEVLAALLGGHIHVATAEPWVAQSQAEAGRARILGVVAEERMPMLPNVPTLVEQGYDVTLPMQRGVFAAASIPDEARRYLIDVFTQLSRLPEWKQYLAKEGLLEAFLAGDEYEVFLEQETAKWEELLKAAGVIR